ncbi:hypothetical protein JRQ81_006159 [Phrynocephalus forsythii]|uniref:Uncharacterized protein n=1 Tax=Phrynocephalus forsythii TaxID=171643 RepID=A0A9Q1AUR5_9SAUR|nr:hypothetical protein JRQ81_006159 [Phrynocephalus forsythii]
MEGDQFSLGGRKEEHHVMPEPSAVPAACSGDDDVYETPRPFQEGQGKTEAKICPEEKCSQSPNSSMTTKELQEYWRNEKRSCRDIKVLFEIPSARIVDKPFSKYVLAIAIKSSFAVCGLSYSSDLVEKVMLL